jgi:hypothetical protein
MKKFIVTLMLLFMFTVYYQHSPGNSSAVITNTGNWIQFSENGVFLSDTKPSNTIKVPVTQDSTIKKQRSDPEFENHSILVPANFKLFVPYHNLKAVERN